jgi:hypothetical protein
MIFSLGGKVNRTIQNTVGISIIVEAYIGNTSSGSDQG